MFVQGSVCWVTGLSGSGKSTLTQLISEGLAHEGIHPVVLDGDDLRLILGISGSDFSRDERLKLAFVYARLCKYFADQGFIVIIATIALFHEIHTWNRDNLPNYSEIFLNIPISILEKRDPKRIYARFRDGELSNVAGMDFKVDFPENPDFLVEREEQVFEGLVQEIIVRLKEQQQK